MLTPCIRHAAAAALLTATAPGHARPEGETFQEIASSDAHRGT